MKRAVLVLFLGACSANTRQESVTVVAPPPTKECPPNTVFNGVDCAELLSHAAAIDSGVAPIVSTVDRTELTDEARDLRKLSRAQRPVSLLVPEIQALESLRNATPQSAPDYPMLVRRLAENYSELGYARAQQGDKTTATEARKHAITEYTLLMDKFPAMPNIDEIVYYLAYTYELTGDLMNARRTFYTLISKYPSIGGVASKWIPYAYYSFGEQFRAESAADPSKWQLATQAYLEVLKFATSNILPWAMLRTGQTYEAQGDHTRAQSMWTKLRSTYPQSAAVSEIP
jgi:TolA-binding protein